MGYINLYCSGSPSNYSYSYLPNGFLLSMEECNDVPVDTNLMFVTINADYSMTFNITVPTQTRVYPLSYYTCEGFMNPAGSALVSTPSLSSVKLTLTTSLGGSTVILVDDPGDLNLNEDNQWVYSTAACQFNIDAQYTLLVEFTWDASTAPQTTNPWTSYCTQPAYWSWLSRPTVGLTYQNGTNVATGTAAPMTPGACPLVTAPRPRGRRR